MLVTGGGKELTLLVEKLTDKLDVEDALDRATGAVLNRIRDRFLRETAPDGRKWKRSQAARDRAEGKGKHPGGGGTLYDSGDLFKSIQLATEKPWRKRFIRTDIPYAKYHQFGIGQELRRFMGVNKGDTDVFTKILNERLKQVIGELNG